MDVKLKKLNFLDTHDLLTALLQYSDIVSKGFQDCVDNRPAEFGVLPFYVFCHARSCEGGTKKRLIWCPRLTRPKSDENSMLFKWYPIDQIKLIWMIPQKELWNAYRPRMMMHNIFIWESIQRFQYNRRLLETADKDDLTEEQVNSIYKEIAKNHPTPIHEPS